MILVYLIGVPGSGKTTITREALRLLDREVVMSERPDVPHERYGDVWHLGYNRAPFGGTDALSMSIQPKVIDWLTSFAIAGPGLAPRVIVAEGDRLANNRFFTAVTELNISLIIIHLDLPLVEARARARARAEQWGFKEQNETWWKGRATKTDNLAYSRLVNHWDATLPITTLAANLATVLAKTDLHPQPNPLTNS